MNNFKDSTSRSLKMIEIALKATGNQDSCDENTGTQDESQILLEVLEDSGSSYTPSNSTSLGTDENVSHASPTMDEGKKIKKRKYTAKRKAKESRKRKRNQDSCVRGNQDSCDENTGTQDESQTLLEVLEDSGSSYAPSNSSSSGTDEDDSHAAPTMDEGKKTNCKKRKYTAKRKAKESRKRKRNPDSWVRNERKRKKDSGEEYVNSKNVIVPAKRLLPPCNVSCRQKCYLKFNEVRRLQIFTDFYKMKVSNQKEFIMLSVKEIPKKTQRLRRGGNKPSRRKFTRLYNLVTTNGENIEVCQKMFLATLSITLKRVRDLCENRRKSSLGICEDDKRGMHENHPHISEEDINFIKEHILSFPAFESHYSRSHTQKKYLSPELNVSLMHRLYSKFCEERGIETQNESFYRKIFNEFFNFEFKKPKNDTCAKCDKFEMTLKSAASEKDQQEIKTLKDAHVDQAQDAFNEKKIDKTMSKHKHNIMTVSFDLQKCLPTPYLRNGVSFYKRQLWTFNLTLYVTTKDYKKAYCFIWNESQAKRGGQEIASCLYKFLNEFVPDKIEIINLYSDCCGGQNRNIYVTIMLLETIKKFNAINRKLIIFQKFLEPGHTHMEADTIHALIENTKKVTEMDIEIPQDWVIFMKCIDRKPKLEVIQMSQSDFLNFKKLLKLTYVNRNKNNSNENANWLQFRIMEYSYDHEETVRYKNSYSKNEKFKEINLSRKNLRGSSNKTFLEPLYNGPVPLPAEKIKDLKDLMPFIHKDKRVYYDTFTNCLIEGDVEESEDSATEC